MSEPGFYIEGQKTSQIPYLRKNGEWDTFGPGTANQVVAYNSSGVPGPVSLDSSYLADRTRRLDITHFVVAVGSPAETVQGSNLRYSAWAMDGTAAEALTTPEITIPADYSSAGAIFVHWTNLSAATGNVVWRLITKVVDDTGDLNSTTSETVTDNTIPAPAQNVLKISALLSGMSLTAGHQLRLTIGRLGNDAADTVDGADVGMLKLQFTYTADS